MLKGIIGFQLAVFCGAAACFACFLTLIFITEGSPATIPTVLWRGGMAIIVLALIALRGWMWVESDIDHDIEMLRRQRNEIR